MTKKFKPVVSRIKLNPEQAVLNCVCYDTGRQGNPDKSAAYGYYGQPWGVCLVGGAPKSNTTPACRITDMFALSGRKFTDQTSTSS